MNGTDSYICNCEPEKIVCFLYNAKVVIQSFEGTGIKVEFNKTAKFVFTESDGQLKISQKKPNIFTLLIKPTVKIYVPEFIVPDLHVTATKSETEILGGIYGDIKIFIECGKFVAENCAFETGSLNGTETEIAICDSTVKSTLLINNVNGDISCENSYFNCLNAHSQYANFGALNVSGTTCFLRTEQGSINVKFNGIAENYFTEIKDKRTQRVTEGSVGKLCAYAPEGNAVIEFTQTEKEN